MKNARHSWNAPPPAPARLIARLKAALLCTSVCAILALAAAVVIYLRFSTLRAIVLVGPTAISKRQYQASLEEAAGRAVLTKLVLAEVVRQAAVREGVAPTDADINSRLAAMRGLSTRRAAPGNTSFQRADVASDLALDALRLKDVSVTPAEVSAFYAAHLDAFRRSGRAHVALILTMERTDAQTAAELLKQGVSPEMIARQPSMHVVGVNTPSLDGRLPAVQAAMQTLAALSPGQVQTQPYGRGWVTLQVRSRQSASVPPLAEVRDQATRLARLAKAPSPAVEMARLFKAHPPVFLQDKYASYFEDLQRLDTNNPKGAAR